MGDQLKEFERPSRFSHMKKYGVNDNRDMSKLSNP